MKKQQFKFSIRYWLPALMMMMSLIAMAELNAQTTIRSVQDKVVPSDKDFISVELRGGDGGKTSKSHGGQGATVKGVLRIGTGANEIAPGGTLRIIPGKAGQSSDYSAGGGGGTALAYQATANADWVVLAVAGGGGGATIYQVTGGAYSGKDGYGRPGSTWGAGTGDAGESPSGYGGGGAIYGTQISYGGKRGLVNGVPQLADGGASTGIFGGEEGGAGFGSGGASREGLRSDGHLHAIRGGGGGGYSGGDGARGTYGGEGGSSYGNDDYFLTVSLQANNTTSSPQDGYIAYQYGSLSPIQFVSKGNKCLDDDGGGTAAGTNIQTYDCLDKGRQRWFFYQDDLSIRLVKKMDKCIDLNGNDVADGTNVQLSNCDQTDEQKWLYNGLDKTIRMARSPEKCLDATTGLYTPYQNVNVQIKHCGYDYAPQYWNIAGATTVDDMTRVKYIVPVKAQDLAVHSHTYTEIGSNIQLWSKVDGNDAETWYFDGLQIKMRNHRNLCINLNGAGTNNGNNITLKSCNDTNAQQWIYDGLTRTIRSAVNPDKCMEVADGNFEKQGNIQIWDCNGMMRQKFLIVE